MKDLDKALENLKYDKRMKDWNLGNKALNNNELVSHLQDLKDLSSNCVPLDLEDGSADELDENY